MGPVPQDIESLLHRRSDLSTFLVHFTKDGAQPARQNLLAMLAASKIEARGSFGPAIKALRGTVHEDSQRAVCFTETPLEHAWMMCQPIAGRSVQMAPYGLAFTKGLAREWGVNPVWYQDMTPGHTFLTTYADSLIKAGTAEIDEWTAANPLGLISPLPDVFRLTPFWEQMGAGTRTADGQPYRKEFSWEREWRFAGDFSFPLREVFAAFVPEADHTAFLAELKQVLHENPMPALLDPVWSLEKMLLALRSA